ncbi:MAG: prolyl oligopeptidase family serine peptidase [Solirubrobacteraceae bacterium]
MAGTVMSPALWSAEQFGDPDGPVVAVFVHGGFWRARYAADTIAPLAQACAAETPHPWVWNIEYPRVGMPGGGWPGTALAVDEALGAAVQAARGRPVVVVGHSAGGHLALWAAHGHPVAAAVSLAGVCDLEEGVLTGIGNGAVLELLGAAPDSGLYAAASPICRLPLGVPVLLIHGDADEDVPVSQSRRFDQAARTAGDECELHELPGGGHFEVIDPEGRAWPILSGLLAAVTAG